MVLKKRGKRIRVKYGIKIETKFIPLNKIRNSFYFDFNKTTMSCILFIYFFNELICELIP